MGKSSIKEIYIKYYMPGCPSVNTPKMNYEDFLLLDSIDPTSTSNPFAPSAKELLINIKKEHFDKDLLEFIYDKGKYLQWLIRNREDVVISTDESEDNSEAINKALYWFNYNKSYLPEHDINKINIEQLITLHQQYNNMDLRVQHAIDKAESKGAEMVYIDDDWAIVVPKTFEASCFYGQFTKWCTTERKDPQYFSEYAEKGPLYINIDRHSSHKYQFYFVKGEYDFRNEIDTSIYPWDIKMPQKARDFYKKISGSKGLTTEQINQYLAEGKKPEEIFDKLYPETFGLQLVRLDMRYNFLDLKTNQLVSQQWYFFAYPYGLDRKAKVWIQRFTYTYIELEGIKKETEWIEDFDVDAWDNKEYWE